MSSYLVQPDHLCIDLNGPGKTWMGTIYDNINGPHIENGRKTTYAKNAWSQSNFLTSLLAV